jgi:hypothetical protein
MSFLHQTHRATNTSQGILTGGQSGDTCSATCLLGISLDVVSLTQKGQSTVGVLHMGQAPVLKDRSLFKAVPTTKCCL